jgi:bacillithiol system protein YtxJ
MTTYQEIESKTRLEELIRSTREHPLLIFKHSNSCGISNRAFDEFQKYLDTPESASVGNYVIVVQHSREASNELERLTGIRHESPQAILVNKGKAVWSDSHMALKKGLLLEALKNLD